MQACRPGYGAWRTVPDVHGFFFEFGGRAGDQRAVSALRADNKTHQIQQRAQHAARVCDASRGRGPGSRRGALRSWQTSRTTISFSEGVAAGAIWLPSPAISAVGEHGHAEFVRVPGSRRAGNQTPAGRVRRVGSKRTHGPGGVRVSEAHHARKRQCLCAGPGRLRR